MRAFYLLLLSSLFLTAFSMGKHSNLMESAVSFTESIGTSVLVERTVTAYAGVTEAIGTGFISREIMAEEDAAQWEEKGCLLARS